MQKKVNLAMLALFSCSLAMAQNEKTDQNIAQGLDENAFTFSEAQLGEDDDMSSNVTILNSTSNVYASQAGYLFSPARFQILPLTISIQRRDPTTPATPCDATGLGCSPFARHYWGNHSFIFSSCRY